MPSSPFRWAAAAALIALLVAGCSQDAPPPPAAPAVEIATAQARAFDKSSQLPGRISSVRVAEVRARVAGIVLERKFQEGSEVAAGQVLFQIDPAPFLAALARAKGEMARAEAELADSRAQSVRADELVKVDAISRQDHDAATARLKSSQAMLASAKAAVQTAQLDVNHATVRAPIAGRIGRALVTEGALVGQGEATAMALIQQLDTVYADFNRALPEVLRLRQEANAMNGDQPIQITIEVPEVGVVRQGKLLFSDISVDPDTGMVALRAEFPNGDRLLLPGMFVRVTSKLAATKPHVFVPQRAIQRTPEGKAIVMVVGKDGTAQAREVRTGQMEGAQWEILDGLKAGERYVANGATKVAPGTPLPSPEASKS